MWTAPILSHRHRPAEAFRGRRLPVLFRSPPAGPSVWRDKLQNRRGRHPRLGSEQAGDRAGRRIVAEIVRHDIDPRRDP